MQFLRTTMDQVSSFKFTMLADGPWTEGSLYMVQETVGVLVLDIQYTAAGAKKAKTIVVDEEGVLFYNAKKIMVDKVDGTVFLPGDKVYWGSSAGGAPQGGKVNPNYQSGEYWIGVCVFAAGADDDQVMIDLKGDKATAFEPI